MNELDQIRDGYPTQPTPTPEATQLARTQLQDLARAEAATTRRRRLPAGFTPVRLGIGLTTAAATVAVAALGVPLLTPDADPGASQPPAVGSPDQSTTSPNAAPTASQLLLVAAAEQEKAVATTGKYFRVRTLESFVLKAWPDGPRYALEQVSISETWTGKETTRYGNLSLGAHPATAADEAKWRADGSPTSWKNGAVVISSTPGKGKLVDLKDNADLFFAVGYGGDTTAEILALPTTPEALRARLLQDKRALEPTDSTTSSLISKTSGLLLSTPATPKTRAAALRLLAELPGAVVKQNVRDLQGRTGTSITFDFPKEKIPRTVQLIIDPKDGKLLSTSATHPKGGGNVTVLESGWTNEEPKVPAATTR